jgi:thiol-disulfide isomerase/thioredoxin
MKISAASLLLAFTGMVVAATGPDQSAPLPRKAPEFVFNMQDGKQLLLSSLRGKVVAVTFMFTTCPHCQALAPNLANIQKDYAAKGVQFVGCVVDEGAKDRLANFSTQYVKNAFPVGWAPQPSAIEFLKHPISKPFYVPSMAFIDRKGMIQSQFIGNDESFFTEGEKNIRAELDKVLGGGAGVKAAVSKAESKIKK